MGIIIEYLVRQWGFNGIFNTPNGFFNGILMGYLMGYKYLPC
jgi:hypothetical protein